MEKREDIFELVNEKLADWKAQNNVGTPEPDVPDEVRSFLGNLGMLNGIPIYYLIPDERYLPIGMTTINGHQVQKGAFKFFRLDKEWIECLMDGALSIGNAEDRDLILTKAMSGNYVAEVYVKDKTERIKKQLLNAYSPEDFETEFNRRQQKYLYNGKPEPTPAQSHWCYTGFLMRSALISAWPGIEIIAEGKDPVPDPAVRPLRLVRMERIAADTLFCICEGIISQVEIKQPAEVFHFGIRAVSADKQSVKAPGVIDITKLKTDLGVTDIILGEANSALFASKMMVQPFKFIITINWGN